MLLLTGCAGKTESHPQNISATSEQPETFRTARQVHELAQYMTATEQIMKISECPDDSSLSFYFDMLSGSDYFIVTQGDTDYLLFLYSYSDYGRVIKKIKSISKSYEGDTLMLHVDKTLKDTSYRGCKPDQSHARCILRLDNPVSNILVDGSKLSPYAGGFIRAGDRWGAVDKDLNIVLPVVYKGYYKLPTYGDDVQVMYRIWNEEGTGLIDGEYNEILPVRYGSVLYLSPGCYVITKREDGMNSSQLGVIDGDGNLLYGYTDGMLFGDSNFQNYAQQAVYGITHSPDPPLYGVIDALMNIIIPPVYRNITMWSEETENQFYVVEQDKDCYAIFDASGTQKTEFQHSSVYEMQTAYYEQIRGTDHVK